jgi:serine/threonine protein phosphatase PrpC
MRSLPAYSLLLFYVILSLICQESWGGTISSQPTRDNDSNSNNDDQEVGVRAYFRHKTVIIPHDSKVHRGGEDAAAGSDTVLVVADGVGGWIKQKVDPGHYSRLLTKTILELAATRESPSSKSVGSSSSSTTTSTLSSSSSSSLTDTTDDSDKTNEQRSLLEIVHQANWIAANQHLGSATCTTLKLTGPPLTLATLNIGDSGVRMYRKPVLSLYLCVLCRRMTSDCFTIHLIMGGRGAAQERKEQH